MRIATISARIVFLSLLLIFCFDAHAKDLPDHSQNLVFVPNYGQVRNMDGGSSGVLATVESPGVNVFFQPWSISYVWRKPAGGDTLDLYRMDLNFHHINHHLSPKFEEEQEAYRVYYWEGKPEGTRIGEYGKMTYPNLYNGISLHFESKEGRLKYTFEVLPGADPSQIQMQYDGADQVEILPDGRLQVTNPFGTLTEDAPVAFLKDGSPVSAKFKLDGEIVRFEIGPEWDGSQTLYIDPTLYWATMCGGTGEENDELFGDVGADSQGNVYYSGHTSSTNFPNSVGAWQVTNAGGTMDATLVKFSPSGSRIWATYFGGSGYDVGSGIAFDDQDNVYFCGSTASANFPVTTGTYAGAIDGFAVKMSPAGQRLWATFIGANTADEAYRLALDANNNLFVAGKVSSPGFSTTPGAYQTTFGGLEDGFLVKFNSAGVRVYATFVGGSSGDYPYGLAIGSTGDVYLAGYTQSTNFPVTPGAFQSTFGGSLDGFLMKFNNSGGLVWSTYLGGSGADITFGLAVDAAGNVYGTGQTTSTNFPVSPGAFQTTYGATNFTAYLFKFNTSGARQWSTYLGGSTWQRGLDVAVSGAGDLLVTGNTKSANFPVTTDAHQGTFGGGNDDAFVCKFSPAGAMLYSTFYGGSNNDFGRGIGQHPNGDFFITGYTESSNFPTTSGAFQTTYAGTKDAFVVVFDDCGLITTLLSSVDTVSYCQGSSVLLDAGPGPTSYLWNTTATTSSITVSTPGTYYVQVTDANNCTSTDTVRVIEIPQPTASISPTSGNLCPGATLTLTGSGGSSYQWYQNGAIIPGAVQPTYTVTAAGNYTLVASNTPACTDSTPNAVTITASAAPTPNLGSDTTLCPGATLVIDGGSGMTSYTWCNGATSQSIIIFQPGTYCVTVSDGNGCQGSDSIVVDYANPIAGFTSNSPNPLTVDFMDASTNATSWAWTFGDGGTSTLASPSHTYAAAGTYQVCLIIGDVSACQDTFCDSVTVTAVAVSPGLDLRFEISPQPANDWLQVTVFTGSAAPALLRMYDLHGRELRRVELRGEQETKLKLPVSDLAAGVYLLQLETESGTAVRKVLLGGR
jgi:hypothetical protein